MQHLNEAQVKACFPERKQESHKGDYGRLLLLCGSRGYTGAAALAARAALRVGAGLVYLGVPESIYAIEAAKLDEPVIRPLPDQDGMLSHDACKPILELLPRMDAVLFGCGSGIGEGTDACLSLLLRQADCPLILDADGITLLSRHKDELRGRTSPTILTPHDGEFARLSPEVLPRQAQTEAMAQELGCILVRKGNHSLITDGMQTYENLTGNPGMATGGSGDVLAGIIAGLLGQRIAPLQAAAVGVWLHGRAGDVCAEKWGEYGMLPGDMVEELPRLIR